MLNTGRTALRRRPGLCACSLVSLAESSCSSAAQEVRFLSLTFLVCMCAVLARKCIMVKILGPLLPPDQSTLLTQKSICWGRLSAERIFRGFLFFGRRNFSRIFSPDFFSSFLRGKSAQKNPPGKSPEKSSKFYTTKILQHTSADWPEQYLGGGGVKIAFLIRSSSRKSSFAEDIGDVKSLQTFVPAIPQSEVLANFLQEIGEKCGEILAKFFADFRPSISRENGRKKAHEKSSTFSTVQQIKFFHCCISGGWGAQQTCEN